MTLSIANGSFRALADEMPSLVFCADAHGEALYCNRTLRDFTGLAEAALVGRAWLLAVHADDRTAAESAWTQAITVGEPYVEECRLRAGDGHYHWFLIRCVPIRNEGRIDRWIGIGVDIHDAKLSASHAAASLERTQAALAGSEARYRTIFQSMFNFVGLLSTDGAVLEANDAALAFGGLSATQVVGRKLWDTPWWDVGEAGQLQLRRAIAAAARGAFVRYDATVGVAGGERAVIDFSLKPVIDADGAVRQIIPEGRDLTHVKAVDAALLEGKARVQRIVDSGIIAVGYGNSDGAIAEANDAYLTMIGRTRDDFDAGAINWRALTAAEHAERDERAIAQVERDGACAPYEKDYVLPDRRLPIQIAMARIDPPTPAIDHVAIIIDLTAQKAAEAALVAGHAALEKRVAERTAEAKLANQRLAHETKRRAALQGALLQSQKLEALGQLTSSVAHDFNNVLAAITGGFALIRNRTDEPRLHALAEEGVKAANRGADLVRKLLAFARQQNVVSQRVDLHPLFDDLAPQLRHIAGHAIDIVIGDARRVAAVEVDPSQLEAAITNLVVNARDAMLDGGRVDIRFEAVPAGSPHKPAELGSAGAVAIHVTDDGTGISTPVLQRVLEPFFTTKDPGKGTGLGLAMVHGFLMQSGGALRIESVVGRGTTVSLYLPVSSAPPADVVPRAAAETRVHRGGRVLLVEDDPFVRDVVTAQLADLGYRIVQAGSAAAAMATVADGAPLAFIITDHGLAGSDGLKLVTEARAVRPGVPILFITGRAEPQGLEFEAVLLKPFSPDALAKAILDMVEGCDALAVDAALLDRLAVRFRSHTLRRMLVAWRGARHGCKLPPTGRVSVTRADIDLVAHVAVDQTHVPMTFALTKVGAELARRAETDFRWWRLDVTGENLEISQEGAYRRCVRSQKPTYDFARFDFGAEGRAFYERLLLPCSDDGVSVTGLMAVIAFDEHPATDEA